MIQHFNPPKLVILLTCLIVLISIILTGITIVGSESMLIESGEFSLVGAIPIAILAVTMGSLIVILCARSMLSEAFIVFLLLISIEFLMAVVTAIFYQLDDEQWLHQWAVEAIHAERSGWDYSFFIGGLYSLFGPNLLAGKFVNGVVTALLPLLVFRIAQTLFSDWKVAHASFYWCCFSVPLLLYGAFSMKESLTAFFLTAALGGLALANRHALAGWSFAFGSALTLAVLRPVYSAIAVSAIIAYLLTAVIARKHSIINLLLLTIMVASSFFFMNIILSEVNSRFSISYLDELQHRQTFAGQILSPTNAMTPSNLLIAGFGGIYFPPPIKFLLGIGDIIEALTMMTWYVIFPFFVFGLVHSPRSPLRNAIGCAVLIGTFVACVSLIFGGVSHRHRVPLLPLMCIMSGNVPPTKNQQHWLCGWGVSVLVLNCVYWYVRGSIA
jgi:hypothetical protein